eukprot:gb/GFBE01000778.1/.p1 GENE.gb/GFBE01000778.1/~~gb/GFBE01000778.1/.p1  ORF type:complete len:207 (+),score=41.93 gb/GFBE01000778.1/:1-621(+)
MASSLSTVLVTLVVAAGASNTGGRHEGPSPAAVRMMRAETEPRPDSLAFVDGSSDEGINATEFGDGSNAVRVQDCSKHQLKTEMQLKEVWHQGECESTKTACGSAYCPNKWVTVDRFKGTQPYMLSFCQSQTLVECGASCMLRNEKICSGQTVHDCKRGYETKGGLTYLCKWNPESHECYRAGSNSFNDYPQMFHKCYGTRGKPSV